MADAQSGGGSNGMLAFIVGALLVAVLVLGYVIYNGGFGGREQHDLNLKVETPDLPKTVPVPVPAPAQPNN